MGNTPKLIDHFLKQPHQDPSSPVSDAYGKKLNQLARRLPQNSSGEHQRKQPNSAMNNNDGLDNAFVPFKPNPGNVLFP